MSCLWSQRTRGFVSVVLTGGILVACNAQTANDAEVQMSTLEYVSIESLVNSSDRIVFADVIADGRPAVDRGMGGASDESARSPVGSGPVAPGVDVLVFDVQVVQDLIPFGADSTNVLSIVYPAFVGQSGGATPLRAGQRVVMFLAAFPKPGIDGLSFAYAPLSYDNGVFDVEGSEVVARDLSIAAIRQTDLDVERAQAVDGPALRMTTADLLDAVSSLVSATPIAVGAGPMVSAP